MCAFALAMTACYKKRRLSAKKSNMLLMPYK